MLKQILEPILIMVFLVNIVGILIYVRMQILRMVER